MTADAVKDFAPAGWKIEEQATGDLNQIPKKKISIEEADNEKFEEEATKRLHL